MVFQRDLPIRSEAAGPNDPPAGDDVTDEEESNLTMDREGELEMGELSDEQEGGKELKQVGPPSKQIDIKKNNLSQPEERAFNLRIESAFHFIEEAIPETVKPSDTFRKEREEIDEDIKVERGTIKKKGYLNFISEFERTRNA